MVEAGAARCSRKARGTAIEKIVSGAPARGAGSRGEDAPATLRRSTSDGRIDAAAGNRVREPSARGAACCAWTTRDSGRQGEDFATSGLFEALLLGPQLGRLAPGGENAPRTSATSRRRIAGGRKRWGAAIRTRGQTGSRTMSEDGGALGVSLDTIPSWYVPSYRLVC